MQKKSVYILVSVVSFIILTVSAFPQNSLAEKKIYKENRDYVSLKSQKLSKDTPHFNHPFEVTSDELEAALDQVVYQNDAYSIFSKETQTSVFTPRQKKTLAIHGARAFAEAKDNQTITFFLSKTVQKIRRYTKGKMFIQNDKLNIIFDRINEPGADNDPSQYNKGLGTWQVTVNSPEQYLQPKKYGGVNKNWLVMKIK